MIFLDGPQRGSIGGFSHHLIKHGLGSSLESYLHDNEAVFVMHEVR